MNHLPAGWAVHAEVADLIDECRINCKVVAAGAFAKEEFNPWILGATL